MTKTKLIPIIGLETHVELKTSSKMFCSCRNDHFGVQPNTHTCPVCLGLPGALPVPNQKAIDWTILIALSLNCQIAHQSKFDRKHYFYPDLPKGYQISQYDQPLSIQGYLETTEGKINITRVHLEEDTGKLLHQTINGQKVSLIDFNRSGVPLVEIVSEPEIHSSAQAKEYLKKLQQIIRYLGVSDCDMEKGSLRLEANISLSKNKLPADYNLRNYIRLLPKYKVEVKNLNSFRFVQRAINYEINRQQALFDQGQKPVQETRGWAEKRQVTVSQRAKETAQDYRYFPEPDIPPLTISAEKLSALKAQIPELPDAKAARLTKQYQLRPQYAELIVTSRDQADFIEKTLKIGQKYSLDLNLIASQIINRRLELQDKTPAQLITHLRQKQTTKITDPSQIKAWAIQAVKANPQAVKDYHHGKTQALGFLIGHVARLSSGKADPLIVRQLLLKSLSK